MHDSILTQMAMEHDHHSGQEHFGNDGWVEINSYASPQQQSPINEYTGFGFMQQSAHGLPIEPNFTRMAPPASTHPHQQLLPLIMPASGAWPSQLTNSASYQTPPMPIPPQSAPLKTAKAPAAHTTTTPRKTLTDADRRRMCQYHEDNPSVKQTEIGGESHQLGLLS
jgi:hypothetical protein